MSFMLYLTEPHFQQVLLTALLTAAIAGALGVFLVLRGMALFGDGVAHISFAGIALGFIFGIFPLGVALATSILGALLIEALYRSGRVRSDAAIGIVFTASLALGIVLVSRGGSIPTDIESYLFGNLVLASSLDFRLVLGAGAVVAIAFAALYRPLLVWSFDEEAARVQGLPVGLLSALFTILTAATIVIAARVVGVLLVSALLIIPASASLLFGGSFRIALGRSIGFGIAATLAGLAVSATWDLAPGGTIALCAAAVFFMSLAAVAVRQKTGF